MAKHHHDNERNRTYAPSTCAILCATAGLGTVLTTGCLRLKKEHCALHGGDIACEEQMCVVSLEKDSLTTKGCMDAVPSGGEYAHAKYGLPESFETFLRQLETAVQEKGLTCEDIEEARVLKPDYETLFEEVIEPLDGKSRVRRDSIPLERIGTFNDKVDAWLAESCEEQAGTTTEGGTDTDLPPATSGSTTDDSPECDCPAARPFCGPTGAECVSCDGMPSPDVACAELDPLTPLCVDGACVSCTEDPTVCADQRLLCDAASHACMPCTEHGQCEAGACELAVGMCFPVDARQLEVDGSGGAGSYASVSDAVEAVEEGGFAVIRVHAFGATGDSAYDSVVVEGGKTIALLAAPDGLPLISGDESSELLRVEGPQTAVYVDGLRLAGHLGGLGGLRVTNGLAWMDRTRIVQNSGGGIIAEADAELVLRNSIVSGNGSGAANTRGLEVTGGAHARVLYTTVARNDAQTVDSIHCDGGTVEVRNSIVVGRDGGSIDCLGIEVTTSAVDENIDGGDNKLVNADMAPGWFFSIAEADYHLSAAGEMEFGGVAQWQPGNPLMDIDGEARPQTEDGGDYAGADVYNPDYDGP